MEENEDFIGLQHCIRRYFSLPRLLFVLLLSLHRYLISYTSLEFLITKVGLIFGQGNYLRVSHYHFLNQVYYKNLHFIFSTLQKISVKKMATAGGEGNRQALDIERSPFWGGRGRTYNHLITGNQYHAKQVSMLTRFICRPFVSSNFNFELDFRLVRRVAKRKKKKPKRKKNELKGTRRP